MSAPENGEELKDHSKVGEDVEWIQAYEEWAREDEEGPRIRRAALQIAAKRWRDE